MSQPISSGAGASGRSEPQTEPRIEGSTAENSCEDGPKEELDPAKIRARYVFRQKEKVRKAKEALRFQEYLLRQEMYRQSLANETLKAALEEKPESPEQEQQRLHEAETTYDQLVQVLTSVANEHIVPDDEQETTVDFFNMLAEASKLGVPLKVNKSFALVDFLIANRLVVAKPLSMAEAKREDPQADDFRGWYYISLF